ncbi:hypothetical protein RFI_00047, partial [Reticulomyxa filosa]
MNNTERTLGFELTSLNDVVISVAVFHSNKSSCRFTKANEFLLFGKHFLCDLRDQIQCLMDKDSITSSFKNSFFFIENVFYDDMRHDGAHRISQFIYAYICYVICGDFLTLVPKKKIYIPIVDWCRSASDGEIWKRLGVFRQEDMNRTRFFDLNLRLGSHYLFVHQGNCEHIIVVTSIRMAHRSDPVNIFAYPFTSFQQLLRRQKCYVCEMFPAKFVTYGDKYTTHNPFYFCQKCYFPLHYDRNGNLLYDDFARIKQLPFFNLTSLLHLALSLQAVELAPLFVVQVNRLRMSTKKAEICSVKKDRITNQTRREKNLFFTILNF